jgi:hypothetical protein
MGETRSEHRTSNIELRTVGLRIVRQDLTGENGGNRDVLAGVPPAVEGGILPLKETMAVSVQYWKCSIRFVGRAFLPPGGKPGSTSAKMAAYGIRAIKKPRIAPGLFELQINYLRRRKASNARPPKPANANVAGSGITG